MCLACGLSGVGGDWTLAGISTRGSSADAEPDLRSGHLASLLRPYGLSVRRSGFGAGYLVADATGRSVRAASTDALWSAVRVLTGRVVDPLDPAFLARGDA